MSTADVIKKSVLEKFQTTDLTTTSIAITLGMAILLGLFIYLVYRVNTKSGFYNKGFNKSLATLPVITAAILLAMGSNLTISLGMVGALSIVRFRNAVKEPGDLTYLFWSISIGIIVGAGLFELAILVCLAMAVLVFFLDMLPAFRAPCLLVIAADTADVEEELLDCIKAYTHSVKLRSRNVGKKGAEWIFEMQTRKENDMLQKITQVPEVASVHLMTHDGDVRF